MKAYTLREYINKYYNGKDVDFAEAIGVLPQQVTRWKSKRAVVINHVLYSKSRELKQILTEKEKALIAKLNAVDLSDEEIEELINIGVESLKMLRSQID